MSQRIVTLAVMTALAAGQLAAAEPESMRIYAKPGLWELTRKSDEHSPPMTSRLCIDAASRDILVGKAQATQAQICKDVKSVSRGPTVVNDSTCMLGKHTIVSHQVVTFTGDTAYHAETHSTITPPMFGGRGKDQSVQDGQWKGACPPNMKAGDMELPGGHVMNIKHMGKPTP